MIMSKTQGQCCNPFGKKNHQQFQKLCVITDNLIDTAEKQNLKIKRNGFICQQCRNQLYKKRKTGSENVTEEIDVTEASTSRDTPEPMEFEFMGESSEERSENSETDSSYEVETLDKLKKITNELLYALGINVIDNNKFRSEKYQTELAIDLYKRLNKHLFTLASTEYVNDKIIEQLKTAFDKATSRDMKIKILSVLPKEWSVQKIKKMFGGNVSWRLIRQTKKLVEQNGILCGTTKKIGSKSIEENTFKKVIEFYNSPDISRVCPGLRECVTKYNEQGEKIKKQRRLVLMNLKEAFEIFKSDFPDHKIKFSKFASIRPIECVLAGSTYGIHTTCVCTYHQNVKLIFDSLKKSGLLNNAESYRDIMNQLLCKERKDECHLNNCELCPGVDAKGEGGLRQQLRDEFEENMFENVRYKQWIDSGCKFFHKKYTEYF